MREIKFRAWDTHDKRWISEQGDDGADDYPVLYAVGLHGLPICLDKDSFKHDEITGWNRDHNIILCEYTGLQDKNGQDIYEGDILATENTDAALGLDLWSRDKWGYGVVVASDHAFRAFHVSHNFWLTVDPDDDSVFNIDFVLVIGNIHQNPELLEAKS